MATATLPQTSTVSRGFPTLCCPLCGEEGNVTLDTATLSEFHCNANDCDFTADDLRERIKTYTAILAWIELAPVTE